MNCSERMKQRRDKANRRFRRMFLVTLLMGGVIGFLLGLTVNTVGRCIPTPEFSVVTADASTLLVTPEPTPEPIPAPTVEPELTLETAPEPVLLGTYRITAYCSCEKCCGEWAKNRPGGIVYGAAGVELKPGISCASPLPFGTVVEIEGLGEYTVQDRMAAWVVEKYGENLIDIYFTDHEAACDFGLQYLKVYQKECTNDPV